MLQIDEKVAAYLRRVAEHEDEHLRAARARSEEADIPAVAPLTGAALRLLARIISARHVVEIGTGGGYSGLWLLGGMDDRGHLTTVEVDANNQALAQQAFVEARMNDRVRSMLGPALAVLPKLADASYDIVFLDAVKAEYPEYLTHAKRLLRPGGLVLADNALWHGRAADERTNDADTEGVRRCAEAVRDDVDLYGMVIPVGDGLLVALHQPTEGP